MLAFLMTPLARWIGVGILCLALLGVAGYYKHQNAKLQTTVIALQNQIAGLELTLKAERAARERAEKAMKMTPEELLEYWNNKKDKEESMYFDDKKKKARLDCLLLAPWCGAG